MNKKLIVALRKVVSSGRLYHFTSYYLGATILRTNELKPGSSGYVSFTRNPDFGKGSGHVGGVNTEIALVINKDKLSGYGLESYDHPDFPGEEEERTKSAVKPVRGIIEEVVLYKKAWDKIGPLELAQIGDEIGDPSLDDGDLDVYEDWVESVVGVKAKIV